VPAAAAALDDLVDRSGHIERLLGDVIELAVDDHAEPLDRILELHVFIRRASIAATVPVAPLPPRQAPRTVAST